MDTLITFLPSINERSFQLFVSSLIFFIKVLYFSLYRSFTPLVKFIYEYFFGFDATMNGIVFFISFLDISLLVYRNVTDFCMLILYSATLLNLLISSNSFLVGSLVFSIYILSCHLQIMTILLFPCQFGCLLFIGTY